MLRRCLATLILPLAVGCAQEPDFDTRYDEAEQAIAEKAEAIDAELEAEGEAGAPGEDGAPED